MKTLPIKIVAICSAILPFAEANAGGPASKDFGGFKSGLKFSLVVKDVSSSQSIGKTKVKRNLPIPSGMPKFKNGQTVKFSIGPNGQLKGPGFSIPFLDTAANLNSYAILPSLNLLSPFGATVSKNSSGKPNGCSLIFHKYRIAGTTVNSLTINQVSYILE
jgi:hypothetical protein